MFSETSTLLFGIYSDILFDMGSVHWALELTVEAVDVRQSLQGGGGGGGGGGGKEGGKEEGRKEKGTLIKSRARQVGKKDSSELLNLSPSRVLQVVFNTSQPSKFSTE